LSNQFFLCKFAVFKSGTTAFLGRAVCRAEVQSQLTLTFHPTLVQNHTCLQFKLEISNSPSWDLQPTKFYKSVQHGKNAETLFLTAATT